MKEEQYQKVEDRPHLLRDTHSKALINTDTSEFKKYKEQREIKIKELNRVEKLEKERCKCNDNKPGVEPPEISDKIVSPPQTFVTNYDEDDECLTCSA